MDVVIAYSFRFVLYTLFGLSLEVIFSVTGIERALGYRLQRRVPRKYLEGFVSLYMIPLHGLGLLFGFEPFHALIRDWFVGFRFLAWAVIISLFEVAWGFLCDKVLGFYSWDYYAQSRYRVFRRGYTLWTLVPLWGLAGLLLEVYSDLLIHLSPHVVSFFS
ncbi:MAG: hypothetical protein JW797_05640 [Bradymonadales bacterium]|nr:hypothetical protein [Bradymonadales bacterium]